MDVSLDKDGIPPDHVSSLVADLSVVVDVSLDKEGIPPDPVSSPCALSVDVLLDKGSCRQRFIEKNTTETK